MILTNEKKIAIFEDFFSLKKALTLIQALKHHNITIYLSYNRKNYDLATIDYLTHHGFSIASPHNYTYHDYILVDCKNDVLNTLENFNNGESFILFNESFIENYSFLANRKNIIFFMSQLQMDNFLTNHAIMHYKKSSPYNSEQILVNDNLQLSLCDISLFDANTSPTKYHFDNNLPTISFINNGLLRKRIVQKSLTQLSKFYNIICASDVDLTISNSNIIIEPLEKKFHIAKFANFNLCSIYSEELIQFYMRGYRTIPIFTRHIDSFGMYGAVLFNKINLKRFYSFTEFTKTDQKGNEFLSYFPAIDIENKVYLQYIMNNKSYWEKYDKELIEICQKEQGQYLYNNQKKTINIFKRLLQTDNVQSQWNLF